MVLSCKRFPLHIRLHLRLPLSYEGTEWAVAAMRITPKRLAVAAIWLILLVLAYFSRNKLRLRLVGAQRLPYPEPEKILVTAVNPAAFP